MGNFEKLSVLVIVVIIVMILVVAIYTWTDNPDQSATTGGDKGGSAVVDRGSVMDTPPDPQPMPKIDPWEEIFKKEQLDGPQGGTEPGPDPKIDTPPEPTPDPEPKPEPKPEPASSEPWMYTVQSGDTLSEIAMRELGSMRKQSAIMALNPGLDADNLRVGQQIKMPPKEGGAAPTPGTPGAVSENPPKVVAGAGRPTPGQHYVTRSGDTLEKISKRAYGKFDFWGEIWARNLSVLSEPKEIRPGMKLFIPVVKAYGK